MGEKVIGEIGVGVIVGEVGAQVRRHRFGSEAGLGAGDLVELGPSRGVGLVIGGLEHFLCRLGFQGLERQVLRIVGFGLLVGARFGRAALEAQLLGHAAGVGCVCRSSVEQEPAQGGDEGGEHDRDGEEPGCRSGRWFGLGCCGCSPLLSCAWPSDAWPTAGPSGSRRRPPPRSGLPVPPRPAAPPSPETRQHRDTQGHRHGHYACR